VLLFRPFEECFNKLIELRGLLQLRDSAPAFKQLGLAFSLHSQSRSLVFEAGRLLYPATSEGEVQPIRFATFKHSHSEYLPPLGSFLIGQDGTLPKPRVKVGLPVSDAVSADLYERNASLLAPPLS
jgi:hypothetical protein